MTINEYAKKYNYTETGVRDLLHYVAAAAEEGNITSSNLCKKLQQSLRLSLTEARDAGKLVRNYLKGF